MSKRIPFSADTSTGELVCDAIADHVLGWYAKVVSRKDGVVRNTKSFKTYRELASFCHGMFKGFHEVEVGAAENDAITDAQLQAMVDADELPTGLRGKVAERGIKRTVTAPTIASVDLSAEDGTLIESFESRYPQYFDRTNAALQFKLNDDNLRAAVKEWRKRYLDPLTFGVIDEIWANLGAMGCQQTNPNVHKRTGSYGGRCANYEVQNDPMFIRPREFTEAEILAYGRCLPPGVHIDPGTAIRILGDSPLTHALISYWQQRGGR